MRPSLASDVARVFSHVPAQTPQPPQRPFHMPFQGSTFVRPQTFQTRKETRKNFKCATKKGFEKTVKVVFLSYLALPCSLSMANIKEGMITLNSCDNEETVMKKLEEVVGKRPLGTLSILSYTSKTLNFPHVSQDFRWTGESVKANIGQGKLYVMLPEEQDQVTEHMAKEQEAMIHTEEMDTANTEEMDTITSSSSSQTDIQDATVRNRHRLSLTMRRNVAQGPSTPPQNIAHDNQGNRGPGTPPPIIFHGNQGDGGPDTPPPIIIHGNQGDGGPNAPPQNIIHGNQGDENEDNKHSVETSDKKNATDGRPDLSMTSILTWWIANNEVQGDPPHFVVNRNFLLKSTLRIVHRKEFHFGNDFRVVFSGEDGADEGGPKREFLRLLIADIIQSFFQGDDMNKFFMHDLDKLSKNEYEMAGKLTAFSLLNGGPGFGVMNEAVYEFMTEQDITKLPSISACIFDYDVREKLQQIEVATHQDMYNDSLNNISSWSADRGLAVHMYRRVEEKENLLHVLIRNEIIYSVHAEIDQFRRGLNKVSRLMDAMMLAPSEFRTLFCFSRTERLTFSKLRSLYKVNYSEEGSNNRRLENNAVYCFEAYLADCEGGASGMALGSVLSFWTGSDKVPPLGFRKPLEVSFGSEKRLPTAHTCNMELNIWREYKTLEEFEADMEKAIEWSGGGGGSIWFGQMMLDFFP